MYKLMDFKSILHIMYNSKTMKTISSQIRLCIFIKCNDTRNHFMDIISQHSNWLFVGISIYGVNLRRITKVEMIIAPRYQCCKYTIISQNNDGLKNKRPMDHKVHLSYKILLWFKLRNYFSNRIFKKKNPNKDR